MCGSSSKAIRRFALLALLVVQIQLLAQVESRVFMLELEPPASCYLDIVGTVELEEEGSLLCAKDTGGATLLRTTALGDVIWHRKLMPSDSAGNLRPQVFGRWDQESVFVAGNRWPGNHPFLAKVSLDGSLLWLKQYQFPGVVSLVPTFRAVVPVPGGIRGLLRRSNELWIAQFNDDGEVQWCRKVDPPSNLSSPENIQMAGHDNGFQLISCVLNQQPISSTRTPWLLLLDPDGEITWQRSYNIGMFPGVRASCTTDDGGFVIGGLSSDTVASPQYNFLMKLDGMGQAQWLKACDLHSPHIQQLRQASDGGYLIVTRTNYTAFSGSGIYKMDANGAPVGSVWAQRWGIATLEATGVIGLSVISEVDNGVRVTGSLQIDVPGWGHFCGLHQQEVLWNAPYPCRFDSAGFSVEDRALPVHINTNVQLTEENMTSYLPTDFQWTMEVVVAESFCAAVTGIAEMESSSSTTPQTVIVLGPGQPIVLQEVTGQAIIEIVDLNGRVCGQLRSASKAGHLELETTSLAPGQYIIRILNEDGRRSFMRFVLL